MHLKVFVVVVLTFMESRISAISEQIRQVAIQHLVLCVPHFVIDGDKILLIDPGTHLDPEVIRTIKVPS